MRKISLSEREETLINILFQIADYKMWDTDDGDAKAKELREHYDKAFFSNYGGIFAQAYKLLNKLDAQMKGRWSSNG